MIQLDCTEELVTQHHKGVSYGFGPVLDNEHVALAIFDIRHTLDNRILPSAFDKKQLARHEFSVARTCHMNLQDFDLFVVKPKANMGTPLVGVARAQVAEVRKITWEFEKRAGRGICAIDKVTPDDFDAHAVLGYSESLQQLTDKQKKNVRPSIAADLAESFGEILTQSDLFES